jgi:hypothetical protein
VLLFFQQQKKSNQKNAVPRRFFILINKSLFNAPAWTAHPCAEPSLMETSCFHLLKELIFQEKRTEIFVAALVGFICKKVWVSPLLAFLYRLFISFRLEAGGLTFIVGIPPLTACR